MRINLSCGYFLMAQHTLDSSQIGSALKQMGSKGVTESVGTYRFGYSGHRRKILYNVEHHYP